MWPHETDSAADFPSTVWTCIQAAQVRGHPDSLTAMNRLVQLYWKPVYYYFRARGLPLQDAADLTQELFLALLEKDTVARADPARGRFRAFLRTLCLHLLSDHTSGAGRQRRFERQMVSIHALLGDEEQTYEPAAGETPDEVLDRRWCAALLEATLQRLQQQLADEGHGGWHEIFVASAGARQKALAEKWGLSRHQLRYIRDQVNSRLLGLLREGLREEGVPEDELDESIREMVRLR
jgi:RNA polymerase sigma-70 factor (ECF subfamily)